MASHLAIPVYVASRIGRRPLELWLAEPFLSAGVLLSFFATEYKFSTQLAVENVLSDLSETARIRAQELITEATATATMEFESIAGQAIPTDTAEARAGQAEMFVQATGLDDPEYLCDHAAFIDERN